MATVADNEANDRRRKGLALRALRKRLGFTQESAAEEHKVTFQAWQHYEAGKRHLSDQKIAALVTSLDSSIDAFEEELSKIPLNAPPKIGRRPPDERGRALRIEVGGIAHGGALRPNIYDEGGAEVIDFGRFFAPGTRVLRLGGMSMFPYAEPGGFVTYNVKVPPRRGHGCVIEMIDGAFSVKRFERFDGDNLIVSEIHPQERELPAIPTAAVKGVYAIGLRGD